MRTLFAALFALVCLVVFMPRAYAQPAPSGTARPPPPPPDLPPPPPPPWVPGGTNPVMPGGGDPPPTTPPTPPTTPPETGDTPPPQRPRVDPADAIAREAQNKRIAALEKQITELREMEKKNKLPREDREALSWLRFFHVSGFLQPELQWRFYDQAASPNYGPNGTIPANIGANFTVARADGTTTNPDLFQLRRARLMTEFMPSEHARFVFEIDPTSLGGSSGGIGTIARNIEAVGIVKWARGVTTDFGVGIFKVPFGHEVQEYDPDRPFIERSWAASNLFPGEYDTGARAMTRIHALGVDVAVVNGQTLGEKTFAVLPDLNKGKDLVLRATYNLFQIVVAGVSGYYGQGQNVDPIGLRYKEFPRWAFGLDLTVRYALFPAVGETRVMAELVRGQNMDRGTNYAFALPAIPVNIGADVQNLDELGMVIRLEQDLSRRFTLGLRYDFYTPDSAQADNQRDTFGVVGAVHLTKGLSVSAEYAHATDNVHLAGTTPPSRHIDTLVSVFQARF